MTTRFVYGPVPSRRLGRSLGVDLVPFKNCSYDCVYCQLGRTTNKTTKREEYVAVDGVLEELAEKLHFQPNPDFIALAGSGEPTLHSRIGDIIAGIRKITSVPVAVITNGSLLWMPEVRAEIAEADLVMPSLDAGTQSGFERVNRPHRDIQFDRMVDGLVAFANGFKGKIWLEVFVLRGITDQPEEIARIASIARRVAPERVQLNTVSRPPAESTALAARAALLEQLRSQFSCFCEVIAEYRQTRPIGSTGSRNIKDEIVALVSRRPCTVQGISDGLGLLPNEVVKHLDVLISGNVVRTERRHAVVFYEGVETHRA